MKMQSTNDSCDFVPKDTGDQEETKVQESHCCSKCRFKWMTHTLTLDCICLIIMFLFTVGYTTYRWEIIQDDFNSRIIGLEKKLDRLQIEETIASSSSVSSKLHRFVQGENGEENQSLEHSMANIHKRSTNKCNKAKTEKKRRKCLRRERKMKKEGNTSRRSSFIQFEIDDGEGPLVGFGGRFQSWRYSDWAYGRLDQKSKFMLNYETGNVLIKEVGLYLVYAQVTFLDIAYNGFTIVVEDGNNTHRILTKCMMGFIAEQDGGHGRNTRQDRRVTCSSVGIFKLEEGDQVFLRSTGTDVKIDHNKNACFFGFVKLE